MNALAAYSPFQARSFALARRTGLPLAGAVVTLLLAAPAAAQYGQPGYGQPGYGQPGYGYPAYPPAPTSKVSTGLEMAYLYGTATVWGVGTGIWIDAEAGVEDPAIQFIPPLLFGAAAPVGVFLVDSLAYRRGMPEGMPSAVATGMFVGGTEGMGIASYQYVSADDANAWGFRGLSRSMFLGSTLGGGAGYALYYFLRPSPQTNMLISSAAGWGALIGSAFGGGASTGPWGAANDWLSLGGLVGFNVAVAGAVGASLAWTPSWNQLGWMWGGYGVGTAASSIVYIFYAVKDEYDARHGLIFQGVAGAVGLGVGAVLGQPRSKSYAASEPARERPAAVRLVGASPMPVQGGLGAQLYGALW